MQSLTSFTRKYAIMEELDSGFSSGSTPEAFVRLDSWEGRIQAAVHVKGLKQGPFTYKLYLIFDKEGSLIPLLTGSMNVTYTGMQSGLEIDAKTLKENGVKPESVRYAAITAEGQDRKWIPLFSSFEKSYKWDESIRQLLLKKPYESQTVKDGELVDKLNQKIVEDSPNALADDTTTFSIMSGITQSEVENSKSEVENSKSEAEDSKSEKEISKSKPIYAQTSETVQAPIKQVTTEPNQRTKKDAGLDLDSSNYEKPKAFPLDSPLNKCDINKLEGLLQNSFESYVPFRRSNRGYSWYKVSDLSKLSNIMYLAGVNVPVFANPKILVGLFKFKHILAGLYRGENGANYYVIGVPAKNEKDNRPFRSACRWVPLKDSSVRDMGGYWLVYVSLKSGEIVV